jgi:hypothetical protein
MSNFHPERDEPVEHRGHDPKKVLMIVLGVILLVALAATAHLLSR